jgi:hypothetical protein
MAQVPSKRRLVIEDFKSQISWIDKLIQPVNEYMESTTAALNKALTIRDNFAGDIQTVELDGNWPVKLAWRLSSRPVAVIVGNTVKSSGASFTMSSAVQVQWSFNQSGQLQIDDVVGITPTSSVKYKVTLVILTG